MRDTIHKCDFCGVSLKEGCFTDRTYIHYCHTLRDDATYSEHVETRGDYDFCNDRCLVSWLGLMNRWSVEGKNVHGETYFKFESLSPTEPAKP